MFGEEGGNTKNTTVYTTDRPDSCLWLSLDNNSTLVEVRETWRLMLNIKKHVVSDITLTFLTFSALNETMIFPSTLLLC